MIRKECNTIPLTPGIIQKVESEVLQKVKDALKSDFVECVLYGSCARGDFTADSDIDIAILVNCSRITAKKYTQSLVDIATDIAIRYFAIVNFVCIPYEEYIRKKTWYLYFHNIDRDGVVISE